MKIPLKRREKAFQLMVESLSLEPAIACCLSLSKHGDIVYRAGERGYELRFEGASGVKPELCRRIILDKVESLPHDGIWKHVFIGNIAADEEDHEY